MTNLTTDVRADAASTSDATSGIATGVFGWWQVSNPEAKKALVASSLAWLVNMFDLQLFAMVLAPMMLDLNISKATGGLLGSLTLLASAAGGVLFGVIADKSGRKFALIASIAVFTIFTGATGLAYTVAQLAVVRVLLGLGIGGEWSCGAAFVSETWKTEHRGKALAFLQSAAAFGKAMASLVMAAVFPFFGWRGVFESTVIPGCLAMWVCRDLKDPQIWHDTRTDTGSAKRIGAIFKKEFLGVTIAVTLMNAVAGFGWWGINLWIPAYLSLPVSKGGIGLSAFAMSALVFVMQIGMWLGYVLFGYAGDAWGRKFSYIVYLIAASASVIAYVATKQIWALLFLGPIVSFFGAGHYAGFAAVTAEIYPTNIRATAQGFTYNMGRVASAIAPFAVGSLAEWYGFRAAMSISALAFLLAAFLWFWIPETKGRQLV